MSTSLLQLGHHRDLFNGQIEVNTADKQIKYAKTFDLDAIALKVNGVFDYDKNVPYWLQGADQTKGTYAGYSSWFSWCKKISQNVGPLTLSADIASSVALGEQTYNPSKKSRSPPWRRSSSTPPLIRGVIQFTNVPALRDGGPGRGGSTGTHIYTRAR